MSSRKNLSSQRSRPRTESINRISAPFLKDTGLIIERFIESVKDLYQYVYTEKDLHGEMHKMSDEQLFASLSEYLEDIKVSIFDALSLNLERVGTRFLQLCDSEEKFKRYLAALREKWRHSGPQRRTEFSDNPSQRTAMKYLHNLENGNSALTNSPGAKPQTHQSDFISVNNTNSYKHLRGLNRKTELSKSRSRSRSDNRGSSAKKLTRREHPSGSKEKSHNEEAELRRLARESAKKVKEEREREAAIERQRIRSSQREAMEKEREFRSKRESDAAVEHQPSRSRSRNVIRETTTTTITTTAVQSSHNKRNRLAQQNSPSQEEYETARQLDVVKHSGHADKDHINSKKDSRTSTVISKDNVSPSRVIHMRENTLVQAEETPAKSVSKVSPRYSPAQSRVKTRTATSAVVDTVDKLIELREVRPKFIREIIDPCTSRNFLLTK